MKLDAALLFGVLKLLCKFIFCIDRVEQGEIAGNFLRLRLVLVPFADVRAVPLRVFAFEETKSMGSCNSKWR